MIFFEKKSEVLCKDEHGSVHPIISHQSITQIAWGPYEDICPQELERMRGIKSMQAYSWKRMECTSGLARFIKFSFSDQHINSIKLKNLGSLRDFVRDVLHIPLLKRKKKELQEARGGLVELKARPSFLGFLQSYSLAC